jgi:glucokinase
MAPGGAHLGLDLGATNLKWALLERTDDGWRTIGTGQEPTRAEGGPDAIVAELAEVGLAAERQAEVEAATIGIGIPGLYDPATGATRFLPNIPGEWAGRPIAGPVGAAIGAPAALINDARAFTLAELTLGAGQGSDSIVALTIGTGVGGGIALDGQVLFGHDGTAGELGHQTVEPEGLVCTCGNRGCLEPYANAARIAEQAGSRTAEEAIDRARAGDQRARDALAEAGRWLGIGIANLVVTINPDRIVIGGGVAVGAGDLLFDPIREELEARVHVTSLAGIDVVPAELGTLAGAIGAAVHGAQAVAAPAGSGPAAPGPEDQR